ncbi:rhodanese-like domain-containing protein [Brytella acorum]|uniref:Rhodanese-like domain-containing protein n=1 Tax=Brytella acorum TaxID=2959299 RepID=A0AA35V073_9PROT|nr:rhodanese-like domain-containing protein [Brytella acorum]MDF3625436.1 rhodanese-like domain-containing protein [Brytella acorum]CAI9120287.1 rhodanese-like domain-containing protein [Brytella acorum]
MTERVLSQEAWIRLGNESRSVLIDVRTPQEWTEIGVPALEAIGKSLLRIAWDPSDAQGFLRKLNVGVPDRTTPLYFICRSGARSQMTAELAAWYGYTTTINVADGFEGPPDATGLRGRISGWQAAGLPIESVSRET